LALDNAGKSNAARIAMMAMTTKSSISVKARVADPFLSCEGRRTAKGFVIEQIFYFVVWEFARLACVFAIVNVLLCCAVCLIPSNQAHKRRALNQYCRKWPRWKVCVSLHTLSLFDGTCSHNQSSGIRLAVRTDSMLQTVGGVGRVFFRRDPQLSPFRNCQGADNFGR